MKQIPIGRMNKLQRDDVLNEVKILAEMDSPYIVAYYDSFIENENLCIIMEYCENGDLAQLLSQRHGKHLDEATVWKYFIEICFALKYLHSKKILHRDIKTMNVFLSKGFHVRLGDLGVAKVLNSTANFAHTMVGTPYYLSPELCQGKPYNEKSDVWALGCVLYELCAFKHPFEARNQAALIMKIIQEKYLPLPSMYSREISEIITSCLQKDYRKRPTINDLLALPSIQKRMKDMELAPDNKPSERPPKAPIIQKNNEIKKPVRKPLVNKRRGNQANNNLKHVVNPSQRCRTPNDANKFRVKKSPRDPVTFI